MTLGSHQRSVGKSQVHITPRRLITALGPFKLDPCAADPRPWNCAEINWTTHGLERDWPRDWFTYMNPPFDRNEVDQWVAKLAEHGNGIALLHARTETKWFEPIWQSAQGILFLADRIFFHRPDGTQHPHNSGAPPVLAAFGDQALARLCRCGIAGTLVTGWTIISGAPSARGRNRGQLALPLMAVAEEVS
jgi:hypothetical protein